MIAVKPYHVDWQSVHAGLLVWNPYLKNGSIILDYFALFYVNWVKKIKSYQTFCKCTEVVCGEFMPFNS